MSNPTAQRQGQPVLFLALLLAGWCLARVLTWQSPWPENFALPEPLRLVNAAMSGEPTDAGPVTAIPRSDPVSAAVAHAITGEQGFPVLRSPFDRVIAPPAGPAGGSAGRDYSEHFDTHRRAVGHNLLFAAGMASLPIPRSVAEMLDGQERAGMAPIAGIAPRVLPRWRADGWVVLRQGRPSLTTSTAQPPSYGASQVGAVLAYRLAPSSRHAPAAYLRASRALGTGGDSEGALGLRTRPLRGVPIDLHIEARLTDRPGSAEIRPAAFVTTGFDRLVLPAGIVARGYAQAGYVHGEFATPFADGKITATREVARFDLGKMAVGAGAWGGAQKGAARLDIGPSVALDIDLGAANARLEADYRFRIAGSAQPGNGGALTLSTGF